MPVFSGTSKWHVSRFSLILEFYSTYFKINIFLKLVSNPVCLSSLLVLNSIVLLVSPRSFCSPRTKYTSGFKSVTSVIGALSVKIILLLSFVCALNWWVFDPHKRNINKLGISLLKNNASLKCSFSLVEWSHLKKKKDALVVKQRIYVEMGRWMKQRFPVWIFWDPGYRLCSVIIRLSVCCCKSKWC